MGVKFAISSRLVNGGGALALTFMVGLVLSVLSVRGGLWQQGLLLYALCCLGAAALLLIMLIAMALPRYSPWRRGLFLRALAVLPGSILFISLLMTRGDYPAIHDITTDVENPPVFTRAPDIRDKAANSLDINEQTIQLQIAAYPDLKTSHSTLEFAQAFKQATVVAEKMGWKITLSNAQDGIIEAVATTAVMAFKDDIVVRLVHADNGTLIDLRSASRVGESDLGANAKRIREFMRRYKS